MIKGITIMRPAPTPDLFAKLNSFFSILGFEPGTGWTEEQYQGASFLAPLGNLEIVQGVSLPNGIEVFIEVTGLEDLVHRVRSWLIEAWGEDGAKRLGAITETHWKSRLVRVEPVPGHVFGFWEWSSPLKGRPIAVEGDLSAEGMRFAIVVSRWNSVITDRLLQGALDGLLRSGATWKSIDLLRVPGAWEIPAAARQAAELGKVDGVIALGVLLRGETAHYEAIYNEVSRGIGQSQQDTGVPHAFGVLTCETLEQALNRAGVKGGNKGFEAAIAAIEMVSLKRKMRNESPRE